MKPKARCDNVCMVFESAILEETLYSENLRNPSEANNFLSNVPFFIDRLLATDKQEHSLLVETDDRLFLALFCVLAYAGKFCER